ncbi:MAG: CusA/CzcA family heavy metal efflux RND transporter [Bacteriovoracaceae bacterium]|nr:CusA/CzcA family heavy metal efflux RND transporter [Bacteriovoracaceae bacterium]
MLKKIVYYCLIHPIQILFLTSLMVVAGFYSFKHLPIDAVPDITNIQVQVNTKVEGLGPEEIERLVTFPIEMSMNGIPGVDQVRSITRFSLSQVTVNFDEGTNVYLARQLVSERLQALRPELPFGANPVLSPVTTGLGEIYHYVIDYKEKATGQKRLEQLGEIRSIQDWIVKPRLLTVKGVAEVNTIGGHEKQYLIHPDPSKMAQYGLDWEDIADGIEKVNRNEGGSFVEQTGDQFLIVAKGMFRSLDDIRLIPVKVLENSKVLRVSDIAEVKIGSSPRTGAALYNGEEVVLGTVLMLSGANSRDVSVKVHEKVKEISKSLPEGVEFKTVYNRSTLVDDTIWTVNENIIAGAVLVIIVLLLLVGNVRAALISAIVIPLSLLISFIVMNKMGISGNLMSLGALDFGVITDGAAIVLDNCLRLLSEKKKELGRPLTKQERIDTILEATLQIRKSAGFGEIIVALSFLPVFAFVGVEGKMFIPMASTFIIAILGSLIMSFTFVPSMAALLFKGDTEDKEPWLMRKLHSAFIPVLERVIKKGKLVVICLLIFFGIGAYLYKNIGGEFLPRLDEGSIAVQFIRPVSAGITHSVLLDKKSMEIIKRTPEVDLVFSRIGTAEIALDPMGPNISDSYIILKPDFKREKEEIIKEIISNLETEVPGQRLLVSQPIQLRFNELLEGTRADVSIKVFGDDIEVATETAENLEKLLKTIPNSGDVEVEAKGKQSVLEIIPLPLKLIEYRISPNDILESVGIGLGGYVAGKFYEGQKKFDIVLRLKDDHRTNLEEIANMPVSISGGRTVNFSRTVPLSSVAQIRFKDNFSSYSREQAKRRVAVLINPRGIDTEAFVRTAKEMIDEQIKLPPGIYLEWGGNFKNLQEARSRLYILGPLTLLLILFMIHSAFGKVWQTALVACTVPLALVGGLFSLTISGIPFTLSAGVGFIALCGICILNGVVLVNFFNELQQKGVRGLNAIIQGTGLRLRPVLMTAMTDVLGFIPMAISSSTGAEVQKPVAVVIIGGIVASTVLTLIVLPTLYYLIEEKVSSKGVLS